MNIPILTASSATSSLSKVPPPSISIESKSLFSSGVFSWLSSASFASSSSGSGSGLAADSSSGPGSGSSSVELVDFGLGGSCTAPSSTPASAIYQTRCARVRPWHAHSCNAPQSTSAQPNGRVSRQACRVGGRAGEGWGKGFARLSVFSEAFRGG